MIGQEPRKCAIERGLIIAKLFLHIFFCFANVCICNDMNNMANDAPISTCSQYIYFVKMIKYLKKRKKRMKRKKKQIFIDPLF